jgi:hypothetical protein
MFHQLDNNPDEKYLEVFKRLKSLLIESLVHSPIVGDTLQMILMLFFVVESGSQLRYIKKM